MKISKERWVEAQAAERRFHVKSKEQQIAEYGEAYKQYFEHLEMSFDLQGKWVIEIGPADMPALNFCSNYDTSIIIEPMPSSVLMEVMDGKPVLIFKRPAEECEVNGVADEVWLFNVLQHVIDPDKLIANAKKWAKVIQFFEPVNTGIADCHPHAFSMDDFKRWFGDCVKHYPPNPNAVNFHTHECVYGTFVC